MSGTTFADETTDVFDTSATPVQETEEETEDAVKEEDPGC